LADSWQANKMSKDAPRAPEYGGESLADAAFGHAEYDLAR
jgi:hypothetical protein